MAIKVSNTIIIDDDFSVGNIADTSGFYDDLHAVAVSTTNNINFTTPIMTCTLSAATTFTVSSGATGRTCMLLLDTSSVPYAPTWPSDVNWENNTEPTWSSYQHWQITFLYVDTNDIRGSAVGFTGTTPTESISLHGTGNAAGGSNADSTTTSMPVTADCIFGMRFRSDGNIEKYTNGTAQGQTGYWTYSTSKWNNITPSQTYYIRASNDNGNLTFPTTLSTSYSDTLNTWLALSSSRQFRYEVAGPRNQVGTLEGLMKIEIASDSGGSNIVATGYYYWEVNGTA